MNNIKQMKKEQTIAVIVAAHKPYRMPEDPMYVPLHVGAYKNDGLHTPAHAAGLSSAGGTAAADAVSSADEKPWDADFAKDNTGENISSLNPGFCELTGLYWAWKNLQADYIGLVHYRRHFSLSKKQNDLFSSILTEEELRPFLKDKTVFVPSKRNYYIESLYSHYAHTHYAAQLDLAREILSMRFPDYVNAYDKVVKRTSGYMFNMMILTAPLFDAYCDWLFSILFEMKRLCEQDPPAAALLAQIPPLSDFQARFYGRVSEILFNVWLEEKLETGEILPSQIMEIPVLNLEGENWKKKIRSFLQAKFLGKKYEASF